MIPVSEVYPKLFALVSQLDSEDVLLSEAAGRALVEPVRARRTQPPFDASSMDGYALKSVEADLHAQFKVIGEAAAGHAFDGTVGAGQAVRIFTGAPVPQGADKVVIQEDVSRTGDLITITDEPGAKTNIRPAGCDFAKGDTLSPRRLKPADIALLASMNAARVSVARRPVVAVLATGDELIMPGETPAQSQIIASNSFGLRAMLEAEGALVRQLPIARDNHASLRTAFELAEGADLITTIGGASVGDHDLVADVAADLGMDRAFYKIAMRPGKPLMAGRMGRSAMIGLPGNPVSAMVCGQLFCLPMVRVMQGLEPGHTHRRRAPLAHPVGPNGPREHYMRARLEDGVLHPFEDQDSSLLSILADANVLMVRPPKDGARNAGEILDYIPI
jgi:molybdopterin molybdotransferase